MPKWIHDRAEHLLAKNPSMPKSQAFAIATQQSHALGKSPKGYGTAAGRVEAKEKYDTPEDDQKTAVSQAWIHRMVRNADVPLERLARSRARMTHHMGDVIHGAGATVDNMLTKLRPSQLSTLKKQEVFRDATKKAIEERKLMGGLTPKLPKLASLFGELAKIGAVSDAQAEKALERYESLERAKPTIGQVGRYAGLGAVAAPAIGVVGDAISGKGFEAGKKLRGHVGRAFVGAMSSGAIPLARAHLDRQAEKNTLKKYLHQHGVDASHRGPPTAGKLSAPFEPVEKTAGPAAGRALRSLVGELDSRVVQQLQQESLKGAHGLVRRRRGKEKDSGSSGMTPARSFDAGGYTVDLVKGAFATSAYDGGIGYPTAPQKSFQPGFRLPSLGKAVQHQPQAIKTGALSEEEAYKLARHYAERICKAAGTTLEEVQKRAFKLQGHTEHQGIPVAIENRKGSVRKGVGNDGKPWRTEMKHPYGYIKGTKGADGEEVDAYVGPKKDATHVHVVHQRKEDGKGYDEDKVMLGFGSREEAEKAFLAHYDDPKFLGPVSSLPIEKFKKLLAAKKTLTKISRFITEEELRERARLERRKEAAGAGTRGGFLMSSEMPAFNAPTLKSPIQKSQGPIVEKFAGVPTTPAGILASSKRVGAPRVSTPPGPSIAQVSKPVGFGKPKPGAVKDTV